MTHIRTNDNLAAPEAFASHAASPILAPVVKRPIEGVGNDGRRIPIQGLVGTCAARNGEAVPLGVVSDRYEVVQMRDLVAAAETAMRSVFTPEQIASTEIRDRASAGGAFVKREYTVKAFKEALEYGNVTSSTLNVGTSVASCLSISTGYDGGTATRLSVGTLDLICQNGMVAMRPVDLVSKRHTKSATVELFQDWLLEATPRFHEQVDELRTWADAGVTWDQMQQTIRDLPSISDRRAEQLIERARIEAAHRGLNAYALSSALTYYSSHDSDEFPVRRTGNDNVATTLEDRQTEVRRWVQSEPFQALLAA